MWTALEDGGEVVVTNLQRDEEGGVGVWVADTDVTEGVEYVVIGEDMVCCDERREQGCDVGHCVLA
jgi:hypothetical protein